MEGEGHTAGGESRFSGVLCALPEELGALRERSRGSRTRAGCELLEIELDVEGGSASLLACVSGVGKVRAAQAAALLAAEGVARLLVVGTCGGLRPHLGPGTLVHCEVAAQADLAVREDRECRADPELAAAWRAEVPGKSGWFLTADRPVLSPWRRLRLARAYAGDCVADMETAAAAAVAQRAGIPWAALRAVTDRAGHLGGASFRHHYPAQAGRAADSVPGLLARLAGRRGEPPELPSHGGSR